MILQHRYFSYQRTFPIHEYGVSLEISYMKRFFVTAVYRVTTQSNVILVEGNLTSGVPPLGAVTPDIGQFKSEAKSVAIFKVVHTVKTI